VETAVTTNWRQARLRAMSWGPSFFSCARADLARSSGGNGLRMPPLRRRQSGLRYRRAAAYGQRIAAANADGEQLGEYSADGEEARHGFERGPRKGGPVPATINTFAEIRRASVQTYTLIAKELRFGRCRIIVERQLFHDFGGLEHIV